MKKILSVITLALCATMMMAQDPVITFTKTEDSGPGTTDCGILPGIASNNGVVDAIAIDNETGIGSAEGAEGLEGRGRH